jgi:hypothetical protein
MVYQFQLGRQFLLRMFRLPLQIATVLAEGGITRMTLQRSDYHRFRVGSGVLRDYLATAKHSIEIVSISLNVTQAEGSLISLFAQRISENEDFSVRVTLLNPSSSAVVLLAKSLDMQPMALENEIRDTLRQLSTCKAELSKGDADRLSVSVHDTHPIGSAILLDAAPESGRIQVETKLYRAPRTESFGFEVKGPSDFYRRNYTAWRKVFRDSTEWQEPLPALPKSR